MTDTGDNTMVQTEVWDGAERRSGQDRRKNGERRSPNRTFWERRSGQDRRGHPFYAHRRPA
jgi:hypothetical protein